MEKNNEDILVYVSGSMFSSVFVLYFVKKDEEVSADDWDDAPYQDNASIPYTFSKRLIAIGNFEAPMDKGDFSVDDIHRKKIPWLENERVSIYTGDSYDVVMEKLRMADADIFVNLKEVA